MQVPLLPDRFAVLIAIVVAAARNGVIGRDNALPWRLPDDLQRFKALTLGKPVLMGRRTYESIGRPLPGRLNIVISRQSNLTIPGCVVVNSLEAALQVEPDAPQCAVIGGAELYRLVLPRVGLIHLTRVHADVDGDARFPTLDPAHWRETVIAEHAADLRHAHAFSFVQLERRAGSTELHRADGFPKLAPAS